MVEDLAASYIALKLENEILQAQVQRLMEENAALQTQIPEFQKSRAAKQDETLKKPAEARESRESSELLEPPAASGLQEPPEIKEAQKPPELLESPEIKEPQDVAAAWEPSEIKEAQEPPELQELTAGKPPAGQEPQAPPKSHELPTTWESEPPDSQDSPEAQEPQDSESKGTPNSEESQKEPEYQETSSHLEPLELTATQELLEPRVSQECVGPSDAQEFLDLPAATQTLEGLIVVGASATSECPQAPSGLEVSTFPLEYPLAFSGDAQKLPEFLIQLSSYMRVRGHLYPTEAALVSFVGNRFSGEARRWFQPLLDIQSPLLEQFESFIQVLQNTFDNPEDLEDANHSIRQLCQGEGPVHRYATRFHFLAQELKWNEGTLCIQFREGLASSMGNEVSHRSLLANLSDLIIQCVHLGQKRSEAAGLVPSGPSPSEEREEPENPPAENQPVQAASNRPHLSEAERARRREGHLCLYCGHPGHFARDCPVKPHRAQQAGNMEARR
ncbi:retrotransposon Gag-like protein 3 [Perognathus longimembris pacificus]|uniref:retrotransposon Gag-like protein 3 n=1 Tax=Perognathus longimembris pacificus TaxID=214514 RepID=UPI00201966E1|nr:retrotransposon Gag-like protein 3 [Perognathus longimembris pacificus]